MFNPTSKFNEVDFPITTRVSGCMSSRRVSRLSSKGRWRIFTAESAIHRWLFRNPRTRLLTIRHCLNRLTQMRIRKKLNFGLCRIIFSLDVENMHYALQIRY